MAREISLKVPEARTLLAINNVDNTSDLAKPVSTATQASIAAVSASVANANNLTSGTLADARLSSNVLLGTGNLTGLASVPTARTNLGLAIGSNVQAWDADLDSIAALTTTAFGRSLLTQADAAASRSTIGLGAASSPSFTGLTLSGTGSVGSLTITNGTTLGVRTIATLPLASTVPGQSFRVSDSPVTPNRIVTSDGADWHYEGLPYNVGTKVAGTIVIKIDTTTTGQKNLFLRVPYACTIVSWEMVANTSGSVVIDIWEDTYANYPPVNADSITGSAKPTITAGTRAQSSTLTGWTTSIASGDYLEVEVESVTTITSVTLTLNVERVS
jgi:hypothetical protein